MTRLWHTAVSQYFFRPKFTPSFCFLHLPLVRTAAQNRSNTPCYIRRTADPNLIFQLNEEFSIVFQNQASCMSFEAWLSREYSGFEHVLTIIEPASCAMNIIV